MSGERVPDATPQGWTTRYQVDPTMALLAYPDGTARFQHVCDRGERGVIVCAPALQLGNGHTLTFGADGLPTVRASILCADCGTHGFITDGKWHS